MQLNYERGAIPLYLQIKEHLKKQIAKGQYPYGSLIPSEFELEKSCQVSRITIRQAISELEKEGYVKRERGKGTTVTFSEKIDENLSTIRSFTKEMADRNLVAGTLEVRIEKIKADKEICEHLEVEENEEVFHLYRIRSADAKPVVVFDSYLRGKYDLPLDKKKYMGSMYEVFETHGIKTPTLVKENFQSMLADDSLAKALNVKKGSAIFKRVRTAYNADNEAIEYTISYYRGDCYSYSIELRKRK